jgi:hypothetical protein
VEAQPEAGHAQIGDEIETASTRSDYRNGLRDVLVRNSFAASIELCRLHATTTAATVPTAVLVHIRVASEQMGPVRVLSLLGHPRGATCESQDNEGTGRGSSTS